MINLHKSMGPGRGRTRDPCICSQTRICCQTRYRLHYAARCSKEVVLLLLIYCSMYFPLFVGVLCLSLFCYALLCVHSSFAIILKRKRKLVALLLLSYRCIVTVNVLWLFVMVPWVGLQCVIVVFPDHIHLLFV